MKILELKKLLAIFLAIYLVLGGAVPVIAAPEAVESNEAEEPVQATPEETVETGPEEANEVEEIHESDKPEYVAPTPTETQIDTLSIIEPIGNTDTTGGVSSGGNVGDTFIDTGDGSSNGNIITSGNTNASGGGGCCQDGGISVINDGNGTDSSSNGSATVVDNSTTDQNNSAEINNGLTGATVTGDNSASNNVGDSYITSGDASTTGTIITSANTNLDGVSVSEFNIVDDHMGDYILDFGSNCVSGCDGFTGLAQNSNNGSNSDNDANINSDTNNTTNQNNIGTVNNDMYLISDTGNNTASGNTGGDSSITTGDAYVEANVLTMLNNNLAGNVILGIVNIFGDLIGDIILPESAFDAFACVTCGGDLTAINSGNGSNSDNNTAINQTVYDTMNQVNVADIDNNLILTATTGDNSSSGNTGGDTYITTGNSDVSAQVLNIANTNIIGGNWWLVIVNRAGQWIGQIVGAPEGAMFAGSSGTEFAVDENGEITAINSANGSNSDNDAQVNSNTNNTIDQTNNASVNNNLYLTANTGGNDANNNTGGDNYITTGDAKIVANLINFVNNNIVGGKLLVTFVNVFGNWTGNFLAPGVQKPSNNSNNSSNTAGGSQTASSNSSGSTNSNSQPQNAINVQGITLSVAAGVSGAVNNAGGSLFAAITPDDESVADSNKTLGINTKSEANKKAKINLAWAIMLLPLVPLGYIAKRRYSKMKLERTNNV